MIVVFNDPRDSTLSRFFWHLEHSRDIKHRGLTATLVQLLKSSIPRRHHNRLIHGLERDISSELLQDILINGPANVLLLLVLRVDGIFGFLNLGVLKLLEIVVLITLVVVLLSVPLTNKVKSRIVFAHSSTIF